MPHNIQKFVDRWTNRGTEDSDDRTFWIEFLRDILGIDNATEHLQFQKKVLNKKGRVANKIDVYIPETKVIIEQKSLGIDLSRPQPAHNNMTPFEQAKDYDNYLPQSEKAKWIVLSNFSEFWIYDMDTVKPVPVIYTLDDLVYNSSEFAFLVNTKQKEIIQEVAISKKAGTYVGLLYDALLKEYTNPDNESSLKSLNMLCVRLVFCLYAEDALILGNNKHVFRDYVKKFPAEDLRKALIDLFKILDTPKDKRDPYETLEFPYVNGGLFAKEDIEIPNFTEEIKEILIKASEEFDWSTISPTIFGAVFESTLNPETRRSGGMHYTSIENIHKVIDPLFLDELKAEYESIIYESANNSDYLQNILDELSVEEEKARKEGDRAKIKEIENEIRKQKSKHKRKSTYEKGTKIKKLSSLETKISNLKFLDPACGSGNFLTETYISLRRLENKIIEQLNYLDGEIKGQITEDGTVNPIQVSISQFYGIEINDFAVAVAKTALWIAESQMMRETEEILRMHLDFLPLKTNAFIHEGNALRVDWNDIIDKHELNYIMGNPPFVGYDWMTKSQQEDMKTYFGNKTGRLDYVTAWYVKACQFIDSTDIRCAFVSTNSVVQGVQVPTLWMRIRDNYNVHIDFAYKTFVWNSEASLKASVHCVIIGFSQAINNKTKYIFTDNNKIKAHNINFYLLDAPNTIVEQESKPICNVPKIVIGSMPKDGGGFIVEKDEYEEIKRNDPNSLKYIRRYMMGKEFINNIERYCFWFVGAEPSDLKNCPTALRHIEKVREYRLSSNATSTVQLAEIPTLFAQIAQPSTRYVALPKVSSQRRRYIPIGYLEPDIIAGDKLFIIPDSTIYQFGILNSNVHMAWMRVVAGRLKSDYSYTSTTVYNTFPWVEPTANQKKKIEETAQEILDARANFPNSSLADLYDPRIMPHELQKAHTANDKAVMQAYGFSKDMAESEIVAELMKLYQQYTSK